MHSRPHENTYWVVPGRLLAGEYPTIPGGSASIPRLKRYLDCGINSFIDLTQDHELGSYETLLHTLAAERDVKVSYQRIPIPDMGIPQSAQVMEKTLQAIRASMDNGLVTYVHCWAGIGRTGTVIGCYLTELELSSDWALKRLAVLWKQMEKRQYFARTPQTDEQVAWIKNWLNYRNTSN